MKKILKEFQEFAIQGNMIDMAVGMIIGAAFKDLVNSLVSDLIMPVISLFTGKLDFSNLFISLNGVHYATLKEATDAGASTIKYGLFITEIINFLIMAFVIFMVVREINHVKKALAAKPEEPKAPAEPTEKECPYCLTKINIHATRCPHCTSELTK